MQDYLFEILIVASLLGGGLLLAGARQPMVFFYAALFGTAILKTPELPIVREKFTIVELCLLCLWACWPFLIKGRLSNRTTSHIYLWGTFFCMICLSSSLIAIVTAPPRYASPKMAAYSVLEAVNYCYGVVILWTCLQVLDTWQRWIGAIVAWVGGMATASFVGAAAMAGLAPGWAREETGRICSTLRNENQVPSMILPLLLVVLMIAVRRGLPIPVRALAFAIFAAALVTAIGTGSRTAALMIGFSGVGVAWIVISTIRSGIVVYRFQLLNLSIAFAAATVAYFAVAWSMYDGKYSLMTTPSWQRPAVLLIEWSGGERKLDNTRPKQISEAIDQFWRSPVLGTGPKFGSSFAATGGEVHNTYFSLMLETGFLGLGAFMLLIGSTFVAGFNAARRCVYPWYGMLARCLLVGMVLICLYNATMLGLRQRNIWFLMGMILAFARLEASGLAPDLNLHRKIPRWLRSLFIDTDPAETFNPTTWQPAAKRVTEG
ncbi:O-Antigen ligase [Rubripirellula lacrimiformis]|uniref:O-Antigen ligase n=1 Tax=Rubripirellula lacrimiformis TaxID=1930273 RepID=A0A517N8R8_9BACT|nr:O-antigen ligase family protein [Rubripirellula lacrimiformis]QDT03521.1 O-Antigen ligase [Rubripirellula lacrimiformis]